MKRSLSLVDSVTEYRSASSPGLAGVLGGAALAAAAVAGLAAGIASPVAECLLAGAAGAAASFAIVRFYFGRREIEARRRAGADRDERMQRMMDVLPVGAYVQSEGRVVAANPAMAKLLRAPSAASLIGLESLTLYHPDDIPMILAFRAEALTGEMRLPRPGRVRLRRHDGREAYVAFDDGPAMWRGAPAILIAVHDETEQHIAHQQARLMESRLKQAIDALPMGFAVWDQDERILIWNRWFESRIAKPIEIELQRGLPRIDILRKAAQRVTSDSAKAAAWVEENLRLYREGEELKNIPAAKGHTLSVVRRQTDEGHVICVYDDVTERKRAERALRESESRYRQMTELLPDAVYVIIDGCIVYANGTAAALYGASSSAELLGRRSVDLYHADDRDRIDQTRDTLLAGGKPAAMINVRFMRADGTTRFVNTTAAKVTWDGKDAALVILHDVTELRHHVDALRDSEERYRTLVALMPDAVIVSQKGKVAFINSAGLQLVGATSAEQVIGREALDLVHPDWRDQIWLRIADNSKRPAPNGALEHMRFRLDGSTFWAEGTGADVEWNGARGRLVVIRDISRFKDAEAKLRDANRTLEAFIESSPVPIFRVDRDARVTLWNAAAERVTGWTAAEALGNPVPYLNGSTEAERGVMLRATIETKRPVVREARRVRKDGTAVDYLTYAAPLVSDQGEIAGVVVQLIDITERKRAEQALREAKEAAELANRTKSEFLANMSHELRTPLNAVIGFSELIISEMLGPVGNERYLEYVKDIRQSGTHLLGVINDILDLSKIEAGKVELEEETFDPAEAIAATLRIIRERAEQRHIAVAASAAEPFTMLRADERKVKQILLNLLSNAVKFTPEGGSVTISTERSSDGLVIAVSDTGIGIAPEDVPLALEPFRQVSSAHNRTYEGTGLGLPLTKRLVELHGGRLEIDSAVGQGTTVRVQFPRERLVA